MEIFIPAQIDVLDAAKHISGKKPFLVRFVKADMTCRVAVTGDDPERVTADIKMISDGFGRRTFRITPDPFLIQFELHISGIFDVWDRIAVSKDPGRMLLLEHIIVSGVVFMIMCVDDPVNLFSLQG